MSDYIFHCDFCKAALPPGEYSRCAACKALNIHRCPGYMDYRFAGQGANPKEGELCEGTTVNGPGDKGLCDTCAAFGRHVCEFDGCTHIMPPTVPYALCADHRYAVGMANPHVVRPAILWNRKGNLDKGYRGEGRAPWFAAWYEEGETGEPFYAIGPFGTEELVQTFLKAIVEYDLDEDTPAAWPLPFRLAEDDRKWMKFIGNLLANGTCDYTGDRSPYIDSHFAEDGWGELHTFFGYGDYVGDTLTESNTESIYVDLVREFGEENVTFVYQGYGYKNVRVNLLHPRLAAWLWEEWQKLDGYPVYAEEDWSERELDHKIEYFNEYAYKEIQEYAIKQAIPELTAVVIREVAPYPPFAERVFVDTARIRYAIQYAAEEHIEEDGAGLNYYMRPERIPDIIQEVLRENYWGGDVYKARARVEHFRRMLAVWGQGTLARQQCLFDVCEGEEGYYDPSREAIIKVECPTHGLVYTRIARAEPVPFDDEDTSGGF